MKSYVLVFSVFLYFVFTHINCDDIGSSYNETSKQFFSERVYQFYNRTRSGVESFNVTLGEHPGNETILPIPEDMGKIAEDVNEQRGRDCLKNVTECIKQDDYQETSTKFKKHIFTSIPPLDLSKFDGVSPSCRQDSRKFIEALKQFQFWALKMYDSSAKIPSGILNGNVNQLGDFDMCLSSLDETSGIQGQYCLASIQLETPRSSYLAGLHALMQAYGHFKSKLEDPGHRVPRFSSINWALCVPSSCSAKDVEVGLGRTLGDFIDGTELKIQLEVDPGMCQSSQTRPLPWSSIVAMAVFLCFIIFECFATLYDFYAIGEKNEYVTAFSLRKNLASLLSTSRKGDDIEAVHGIRCINAVLLITAHKSMAVFFVPYANRTQMVEFISKPWTVLGRAASLFTDPFIMLSGALTAYSLFGKLQRTNRINIAEEYASRLFRIVPTFAALIAFCTFVLPWLSNGPMWNLVVTHHSDICKKNWWRNLLFIHNYFGFKDMCLTHTHHVGIDTQLFFASPFLILTLWKWPKKGAVALVALATLSTIYRYYVTYSLKLNNYIHFGTSIQQLFDTADNMYILPVHRATVYIIGIFLGYFLRTDSRRTLSKSQIHFGNAVALFCFLASFFGPAFMGSIDYKYNPRDAAWYAAYAPILWCFSFAWIIYTNHLGYPGVFGAVLSWPGFKLWTKISYTVYLTQFPIFFYNVGSTKTSQQYSFFSTNFYFGEYLWIIISSVALTVLFEMPFQNVRNAMKRRKPNVVSQEKPNVVSQEIQKKID